MKKLALGPLLVGACIASAALGQESPEDPELTRLKNLKAQYELEAQTYLARKARFEAEAASATAKLGPLASYQTPGTVDVGANSGKLEATLKAAEATRAAAGQIVQDLCVLLRSAHTTEKCGSESYASKRLILYTEAEKPTFDAYDAFNAQLESIRLQLASVASLKPRDPRVPITGATSLPVFSTLLSTAGNLLRSDYKVSSVDVTQTDGLLLKTVIEQARALKLDAALTAPSIYGGRVDYDTNPAIVALNEAENERNKVAERAATYARMAAAKPKNKEELDGMVAKMNKAIERFDAFAQKIGTPGDNGVVPLSVIARQAAISGSMQNSYLLILKAEHAGGSAYAQKNFWTFLGGMPFFVSGGSLVSYALYRGASGDLMHASVLGQTQPFAKIQNATKQFHRGQQAPRVASTE